MQLIYQNSALVPEEIIQSYRDSLREYLAHLAEVCQKNDYSDPESSINLAFDESLQKTVEDLAKKMVTPNLKYIVDIGIGGSNLGTKAVYDAVYGAFDSLTPDRFPKMIFADTVDAEFEEKIKTLLQSEIKSPEEILFCLISKSGGTTETKVNFHDLFSPEFGSRVVAITDEGSNLWNEAVNKNYAVLPIPKMVGGRFSVLSAVGLLPLAACGFDIKNLIAGAKRARENFDLPLISAAILYHNYLGGKVINNNFIFHPELESLGKWYRQLMGESLGKEGRGITPMVSVGSTDLHSVGQLYLGGPNNETTTFIATVKMSETMEAIFSGVKIAYQKHGLPFMEVILDDLTPASLGEFFQFKMTEMMLLGKLMDVNTFDQPNVESYKVETRKILAQEGKVSGG